MELMVVIVIVAILAAVAVPLYINYVKDALRTEAKGAIGAVVTAQQTYYQANDVYYGPETFVANPSQNPGQTLNCDLTDALHNWDIQVTAADVNGFTVVATGREGTQAHDLIQTLTFTRGGAPRWDPQ
jgi:Tfp pilus assembly protein PilE